MHTLASPKGLAESPASPQPANHFSLRRSAPLLVLLLSVPLIWCTIYHRWTLAAWQTPVAYSGDASWALAYIKATISGESPLILPKYPSSLGAPFVANWNHYPTIEEGLAAWLALLAFSFGLFPSQNLALLSAHLFAAASFYFVCRRFRYHSIFAAAGALLFSFSSFSSWRNASHLGLTFYWHVPLGLLVVWWCLGRQRWTRAKWWGATAIAIATAVQNPYYAGILLQFLVWASLILALQKRWPRVLLPLGICGVIFAAVTLMNIDTLSIRGESGQSGGAVTRDYTGVETFALKPLELLVPVRHRLAALEAWATNAYLRRALFTGEAGSAYLGVLPICALIFLVWKIALHLARRTPEHIPPHFWYILWIFIYSVVGGLNGFIALFGMVLYRGTNRYSIVICTLLLLFAVRELTRVTRHWRSLAMTALALPLTAFGVWDQTIQPTSVKRVADTRRQLKADKRFVTALENALPGSAMIFQLPVVNFPEHGPTVNLADYEEFRPYIHSSHLRFSYGDEKGQTRSFWQTETGQASPPTMISLLEKYGFAGVIIAKKGYADQGAALLAGYREAGRSRVLANSPDFICVALDPSAAPLLPPDFISGWSTEETNAQGRWRWSSGNAEVVFQNGRREIRTVHLAFGITTLRSRKLQLSFDQTNVGNLELQPGRSESVNLTLSLQPGMNKLSFTTDTPGEVLTNGDPRTLAFKITDFMIN